jgi:hypothetical protein
MIRKLFVALVVLAATSWDCIDYSTMQSLFKESIDKALEKSKDLSIDEVGSLLKPGTTMEFRFYNKKNSKLDALLKTFDVLNKVSEENNNNEQKDEPSFIDYFGKGNKCYNTDDFIIVELSKKTYPILANVGPQLNESQALKIFRSVLTSVSLLSTNNISLGSLSKYSFGNEKDDINSRMLLKYFTTSGILDNEEEIRNQLYLPMNGIRLMNKGINDHRREFLFQNDLYRMVSFLHWLLTGNREIFERITKLEKEFEEALILYNQAMYCRIKFTEQINMMKAEQQNTHIAMEEIVRNLNEDFYQCGRQIMYMNQYKNSLNINQSEIDNKITEFQQKNDNFCLVSRGFANSLILNQFYCENYEKTNNQWFEEKQKESSEKFLSLSEEYKEIEEKLSSAEWIPSHFKSSKAINGNNTLKTVVGEMIKTGEGTKTVQEIITMLDAIISNDGSPKREYEEIEKGANEEKGVDQLRKKIKKNILI